MSMQSNYVSFKRQSILDHTTSTSSIHTEHKADRITKFFLGVITIKRGSILTMYVSSYFIRF